jgi:hypothetical protein
VNTLTKVVDSASGLISSIKGGTAYDPTIAATQNQPGTPPGIPTQDRSHRKLIWLGAGAIGLGAIVYFATRKKKGAK